MSSELEFQSLVGFKINWNSLYKCWLYIIVKFQSLVGFKINWNSLAARSGESTFSAKFQSLVGFKINWNANLRQNLEGEALAFQSLVGFKINWNVSLLFGHIFPLVSIPSRV